MKKVVDIVNFNADASCLSSDRWLEILKGGKGSEFCQWLELYVDHKKKVGLGFPGATIADIVSFNPEAIDLINENHEIFEIIVRPFAHDNALLRHNHSFVINLDYGHRAISKEFKNVVNYYLPPEFMVTNEQIQILAKKGVQGIFIYPNRFSKEIQLRLPDQPYQVKGIIDSNLSCIPFDSELTDDYLHAIHFYDDKKWNERIEGGKNEVMFSWRDGESSFLIPNGITRESFWLGNETAVDRKFIADLTLDFIPVDKLDKQYHSSYPVHSFTAWMQELRMLGYITRLQYIERNLDNLDQKQLHIWLQAINSDILSAVEKDSPEITMKKSKDDDSQFQFTIQRAEKGFTGEEYINIIENIREESVNEYLNSSDEPHIVKLRSRLEYLDTLVKD